MLENVESNVKCPDTNITNENFSGVVRDVNRIYLECGSHHEYGTIVAPIKVTYCPRCNFPVDFCDFGRQWNKCEHFALSEYPQYYSHYLNQKRDTREATLKTEEQPPQTTEVTRKFKKKEIGQPSITIQCVARAKHKMATVIFGLDAYGVKLENAAKIFKKRFACGSSAVKGLPGQCNHVEIQGDFGSEVEAVLRSNFKEIPTNAVIQLKHK